MNELTPPPNFFRLYKDGTEFPPPPKIPTTYTVMEAMSLKSDEEANEEMFGSMSVLGAEKRYEDLYPPGEDPGEVLRKLNHSLLFSYLQLLDVLASNTSETAARANKIGDITAILDNMKSLVDELKPFLVKEAILRKVETQLNRKLRLIGELEESVRVNKEKLDAIYKGADTIFTDSRGVIAESEALLSEGKDAETQLGPGADEATETKAGGNDDKNDNDVEMEGTDDDNNPKTIQALLDTVTV